MSAIMTLMSLEDLMSTEETKYNSLWINMEETKYNGLWIKEPGMLLETLTTMITVVAVWLCDITTDYSLNLNSFSLSKFKTPFISLLRRVNH